jgi:hypothetical protein
MWNVYYTHKGRAGLSTVGTRDIAIDRACELIDEGAVVGGIAEDAGISRVTAAEIKFHHAARQPKKTM